MRKGIAATIAVVLAAVVAAPATATVTPPTATLTVPAGTSGATPATVGVPALPAKADILIAIDTTGSMGAAIAEATSEANALVAAVQGAVADAQFAVVDFKDFGDVASGGGSAEYVLLQPMTANAGDVQAAVNTMVATGGGDFPEAYNVVFRNAYNDPATGWRADSRKFVIVIGDAPPHGGNAEFPACGNQGPDPDGLDTATELTALAAAQRTLMMIAANPGILTCYQQLTAAGFSGSQAASLGSSIATQVVTLITDASSSVSVVDMAVAAAPAGADASWISFAPTSAGPLPTPATVPFTVTAAVPPGTPAGSYLFDLVGRADGGDVGHMALTVIVPDATNEVTINKTVDKPEVARGDTVTYTITVHNGTAAGVKVKQVVDQLPKKIRFVKGSSTGAGTPKVRHSHSRLTWRGPISITPGGDLVISFQATVKLKKGCKSNHAWVKLKHIVRRSPPARRPRCASLHPHRRRRIPATTMRTITVTVAVGAMTTTVATGTMVTDTTE